MTAKQQRNVKILLQAAVVSVFLGRAWQHLFWDAPFRTLLWDEAWMKGIIETVFGMRWDEYITSMKMDDGIQIATKATGVFYLICALIAIFIKQVPGWVRKVLIIGSGSLLLLAALYCKEKFFSLGQFLEYSLQVGSPLFLYAYISESISKERLLLWMKIAIALTFTCHGLYAINFYPRPGIFVEMILNNLGVEESTAYTLLYAAGALDFIISVMIFLPFRFAQPAVLYAVLWGFATATARVASFFDWENGLESLHQWGFEAVYRFPHFLVPLAVWVMLKVKKEAYLKSQ